MFERQCLFRDQLHSTPNEIVPATVNLAVQVSCWTGRPIGDDSVQVQTFQREKAISLHQCFYVFNGRSWDEPRHFRLVESLD